MIDVEECSLGALYQNVITLAESLLKYDFSRLGIGSKLFTPFDALLEKTI